jgi:hypothetical protein
MTRIAIAMSVLVVSGCELGPKGQQEPNNAVSHDSERVRQELLASLKGVSLNEADAILTSRGFHREHGDSPHDHQATGPNSVAPPSPPPLAAGTRLYMLDVAKGQYTTRTWRA